MYMRTGSVVRPNSESTVESAASAGFLGLFLGRGGRAAAGDQQRRRVGRLLVDGDAHVVEHRDDRLEDLVIDELLGQVVVDLLVGQEAARLAHLDERLQLLAALGDLFLGELGLVEAELAHQRALLGARDLHPQRLGLGGDVGLGDDGLAFELRLDVRQIDVGGFRLGDLVVGLALLRRRTLALGRRLARLGRRRRRLLLRLDVSGRGFGGRAGGFRRGGLLGGHADPRMVTGGLAADPTVELRTFVRNSRW
jgi:hypothetical protein